MTEAMKGVPVTDFSQPAPIESLADKAKRDARGGFDLGTPSSPAGLPGGVNYYPSAPLPGVEAPTTTTTVATEPSTTTTTVPSSTTTTEPSSSTTTTTNPYFFRRPSSTTTTTTTKRGPYG
jgi:hypothetical protein